MTNKKWTWMWCASVVVVCACGSTIPIPSFPLETTLSPLAEPRCNPGSSCECRSLEGETAREQAIAERHSRFEFVIPRTKSGIWVEVGDRGVFYKPKGVLGRECFYIDLPRGVHKVRMLSVRNHSHESLKTGLEVNRYGEIGEETGGEIGEETGGEIGEGPKPFWYPVFDFKCNGMNACTTEGAKYWLQKQKSLPKGQLNRCSWTHVGNVRYAGEGSQRGTEFENFVVTFDLRILDISPKQEPGDPACQQ